MESGPLSLRLVGYKSEPAKGVTLGRTALGVHRLSRATTRLLKMKRDRMLVRPRVGVARLSGLSS